MYRFGIEYCSQLVNYFTPLLYYTHIIKRPESLSKLFEYDIKLRHSPPIPYL